ncbi:MAG: adenine deaminase [Phycisphaerae bacterium]|nr:adenine deaminase [Phycisphaerae bacterium]
MRDFASLLPVARGDEPADLVLAAARVINVFSGEIVEADIAIAGDRIAGVGEYRRGRNVVPLNGAFVAPGFIDAHLHIESTMLTPPEFARAVLPHGTTAVVADPHEIANVHGLAGIRYMLDASRDLPLSVYLMLPSCVPATHLETGGAALSAADLSPLIDEPRVLGLAEMMNYPGAIHGDAAVLDKLRLGLRKRIDGHAPGVSGRALAAYVACGVGTDHECTTAAEAREKLQLGMTVLIREGSAAQNLDALLPLVTPRNAHRFCFCTDDRHPHDLVEEGHIDHVIRRAVQRGLDPISAIQMATLFPAQTYGLSERGAIAPGRMADIVVFDDLQTPRPRQVYCRGRLTAEYGRCDASIAAGIAPPTTHLRLPADLTERSFAVAAPSDVRGIRVIGLTDRQITTRCLIEPPCVRDGRLVADVGRDLLKLAVIERHRGAGNIGLGFVRGFGLKAGALAGTVAHDSHNLLIVGTNDADMLAAARAVAEARGGQAAVRDGRALALLPLPIGGLMSDRPLEEVARQQMSLREAAVSLGCRLHDPFMLLSFLALPVIPELKLTDRGLVDVGRFDFVPLCVTG